MISRDNRRKASGIVTYPDFPTLPGEQKYFENLRVPAKDLDVCTTAKNESTGA